MRKLGFFHHFTILYIAFLEKHSIKEMYLYQSCLYHFFTQPVCTLSFTHCLSTLDSLLRNLDHLTFILPSSGKPTRKMTHVFPSPRLIVPPHCSLFGCDLSES
jgi:hypothetical protein